MSISPEDLDDVRDRLGQTTTKVLEEILEGAPPAYLAIVSDDIRRILAAREDRIANHTCHAEGCEKRVKPELLMCGRHWAMVPRDLQRAIWRHYRSGQCDDMKPSREWLSAAKTAIEAVARKEGRA